MTSQSFSPFRPGRPASALVASRVAPVSPFVRSVALAVAMLAGPFAAGCGSADVNTDAQYPSSEPVGFDGPSQSVAASDPMQSPQPMPQGELGPDGQPLGPGQLGAAGAPGGYDGDPNAPPPDQYGDTDPSALTDFRPALDSYGSWVEDPTYGTIWVPSSTVVGSDFTPYETAGHWAYDNDQYLWMSDYSWGWAPFHYGRWAYTGGYGWGWIPGRTYSGGWVSWRTGGPGYGYVGWAPMGPSWGWRNGAAVGFGFAARAPYTFVPTGSLFSPSWHGSVVRGQQVATVAAQTRPYTASAPAVHTLAHPTVAGPSPTSLGISSGAVAHVNATASGSAQIAAAQNFARPSTAMAVGAHAPVTARATVSSVSGNSYNNTYGRAEVNGSGRNTAYSSAHSAVATSPQYRGVSPTPYRGPSAGYARTSGVTRIGSGYSGSGYSSYSGYSSLGGYRGSSYSTPSYHTPYVQHATGSTAAPAYVTQPQQQGYSTGVHSSGGFRGGAGGGGHVSGGGHGGHR